MKKITTILLLTLSMRKTSTLFKAIMLLAVFTINANAQTQGGLDPAFNPADSIPQLGIGANGTVSSIVVQSDGKILVVGSFTTYNGNPANYIVRLNAAGTLDNTFNTGGTGANGAVNSIALQSDGKILIGGSFTAYNGTTANRFARLKTNGTLDNTFNTGAGGANSVVYSIALQSDGKILIGGNFNSYNSATANYFARLNTNGIFDNTFNTGGTGFNGPVRSIATLSSGKILVGGVFVTYNGGIVNYFVCLNTNGSLDTPFHTWGIGASSFVQSISIQSDGKILIGGNLAKYNGTNVNRIARLNSDGSLDSTFNTGTGTGVNSPYVYSIALQSDGKILIAGQFTSYNGTSSKYLARLNADGSLDNTFTSGIGAGFQLNSVALQPDGKILVGGIFISYNGIPTNNIARLNTNSTLDGPFTLLSGGADNTVNSIALQSDNKILIGGSFIGYNSNPAGYLARLNSNGAFDNTFTLASGSASSMVINSVAVQPDGKILIGGHFNYNNNSYNIARLNTMGTLDNTFTSGSAANNDVLVITLQPDGKILIGGTLTAYNGTTANRIARLNADGTLDNTFTSGTGANNTVSSIALQSDGKILIGGTFTAYNGSSAQYIARLNTNGSMDNTFTPGSGANNTISSIALQLDGKILIGGSFTTYNGTTASRIARLNTNGTFDNTFTSGTGAGNVVNSIALQSDGKILIGGSFISYNGTTVNRIARLNTNGTLDNTFNTAGTGANNAVSTIIVQPDNQILVGGAFSTYNGSGKNRIARLLNSCNPLNIIISAVTDTICSGTVTAIALQSSVPSNYYWTIGNTNGITGSHADMASTIAQTLHNPSHTTAGTVQYIVTHTAISNGCIGVPDTLTVTVNPTPLITNISNDTICSGTASAIVLQSSVPSNYYWTIGDTNGITGAHAGNASTIAQTLNNPSHTTAGAVQYIVTPTAISNGCIGVPDTVTVTVNPTPLITNISNDTICSGTATTITLQSSVPSNYYWTIGDTNGITGAHAGIASTIAQTLNNPSHTTAGTVQYIVTPTAISNGCIGVPDTLTVNVNPTPLVTNISNDTICSGTATAIALQSSVPSNYYWTIGDTNGITGAHAGIASTIAQTLNNASHTIEGAVQYVITPTAVSNGCIGVPDTLTVNVNPSPLITYISNDSIASGTSTNIALTATIPSIFAWIVGPIMGNITGANAGANDTVIQELVAPNHTANGTVAYIVTPTSTQGYCVGEADTITVNVIPGVWPGDANHDTIVNNYDLLQIGLYYGQTGTPRATISNAWQAYVASNWTGTQNNGENLKHSDCNGDGNINSADTLAIVQNYSQHHSMPVHNNNWNIERNTPDIDIIVQGSTFVSAGDSVTVEVWVGSQTVPISSLYGVAFSIDYDASLVTSGSMELRFNSSWLGTPGTNAIKIAQNDDLHNSVHGALSRIDHQNASGFGKIAEMKFKLRDDIDSVAVLPMSISGVKAYVVTGDTVVLTYEAQDSVFIYPITTGIAHKATALNVSLYPNPFSSQTTITLNKFVKNGSVKVMDIVGKEVKTLYFTGNQAVLEKGELNAGVYLIQINAEQNVAVTKKIVVQ